jgi:malate dehydrogenase (oxaloacetate-decarboxylating)
VGTNNESLLLDMLYLGKARRRVRGAPYDALLEAFFAAVAKRFPKAVVQFEDFGTSNALRLLERWRDRACCFNDDIQGTGAVTLAGVLAGMRLSGLPQDALSDRRVVIAGAGSAGIGIARALREARLWLVDVDGLVTASRTTLSAEQRPFARDEPGGSLAEVVRRVRPHILVGVTGKAGLFQREMVEAMEGPRPMVFPLSNPDANAECSPAAVRDWTDGRAIVASGSPFPGTPQCNNVYVFPGVGLGVVASQASRVTDRMFRDAAVRLASIGRGDHLFPPLQEIRRVSVEIAFAVGKAAIEEGVAPPIADDALRHAILDEVWEPRYLPYRPAPDAVGRERVLHHRRV